MSRDFWMWLAIALEALISFGLFLRLCRVESLVGGMLTGWKGKKRGG